MISLDQKTGTELCLEVASRVRARRKELGLTQVNFAKKAGMSLGSYKRFEQTGQISFLSLANIGVVLRCEQDFDELFSQPQYASIEEAIRVRKRSQK